jgi:hypothetical protein
MAEAAFLGDPSSRESFVQTLRDKAPQEPLSSRQRFWELLFTAAKSAEAWAGILAGANLVLKTKGRDPEAMQSFFLEVLQTSPPPEWRQVAKAASQALKVEAPAILASVRAVVEVVPPIAFRSLVNLDRIEYCWTTFGDDPAKLQECLANL